MKEASWCRAGSVLVAVTIVCLAVMVCVLQMDDEEEEDPFNIKRRASKIYCEGSSTATRRCTIFNLCLDPKRTSFVFLISNDSVFHGLPPSSVPSTMLGLLDLSSMPNHNAFWLEYSTVFLDSAARDLKLVFQEEPVFFMATFLPSNFAHAIRDDLLPLYFTYEDICGGDVEGCVDRFQLVVKPTDPEKFSISAHKALYDIFSSPKRPPWNLAVDGKAEEAYLCFSEARVGLRKDIRYYDIGATDLEYEQPVANTSLTPYDVDRFTNYVIKHLCKLQATESLKTSPYGPPCTGNFTCSESSSKPAPVVIIHRERSRRILNMDELAAFVRSQYADALGTSARVRVVGLGSETLIDVICAVRNAKLVIGMHGAALELAHFLQPGSGLLEMFPYALDPENYTPYKTICELLRENVFYIAWVNPIRVNSLENPHYTHDGNIEHLEPTERDKIKNMTSVPRLDCCNDLRFRYWLNKDTIIDLSSFTPSLLEALYLLKHAVVSRKVLHPEIEPRNVTVKFDPLEKNFVIAWASPWNLNDKEKVSYLVRILHRNTNVVRVVTISDNTSAVVPCDLEASASSNSYLISIEVASAGKHQRVRRAYVTVVL